MAWVMPPAASNQGGQGASRQLEWYRESTKWLVAISGATIALGLAWVVDSKFGTVGRVLFSAAGVLLLVANGCGILAAFKMADYENSRYGSDAKKSKSDRVAANNWFMRTFILFFLGLTFMVSAGAWLVWFETEARSARFNVIAPVVGPNVIGVLLDRESEEIFLIKEDPAMSTITIEPKP